MQYRCAFGAVFLNCMMEILPIKTLYVNFVLDSLFVNIYHLEDLPDESYTLQMRLLEGGVVERGRVCGKATNMLEMETILLNGEVSI